MRTEHEQRAVEARHAEEFRKLKERLDARSVELNSVMNILVGDLQHAFETIGRDDSACARRSLFRAAFGFVEGTLFQLRIEVLDHVREHVGTPLERGERHALEGATMYRGEARPGPRPKLGFDEGIRFTFRMIEKITGVERSNCKGSGWEALRASDRVRDGLMHPKSSDDLNVTEAHVKTLGVGLLWFWVHLASYLEDWRKLHARRLEELNAEDAEEKEKIEKLQREIREHEEEIAHNEAAAEDLLRDALAEAFNAGRRAERDRGAATGGEQ